MCTARCWLFKVVLASVWLLSSFSIAERLDEVINPKEAYNAWVSDMAGVIDDETERRINALIDELERTTTAEIAVVTIKRTDGRTPKEFATELFNRFGIGKKGKDNGVLVLLVMEERRIEVETGYGMEAILPDGKVGEILDTYVIPRFKRRDFGGGILAGVQAMAEAIAGQPLEFAPSQLEATPIHEPSVSSPIRRGVNGASWFFVIVVLLFLGGVLSVGYVVSGIRHCSRCGKRMRRLTEDQDDAYLAFAQKFEEELGSVDYRVWRCDDCQTLKIEQAVRWFRSYEDCPECGHRTVYVKSYTVQEPTYERAGIEEVARTCRFPKCPYHTVKRHRIPKLQRTVYVSGGRWGSGRSSWGGWSSGGGGFGGGSFGGGSSGGGGAGRSW